MTGFAPPNRNDMAFVLSGNEFLFPYNLHNFYCLRDGGEVLGFEKLRGPTLDRGLGVLEQTLVQYYMDSFPWLSRTERTASMKRLSAGFTSWVANDWIKQTIARGFASGFDFASLDDRIRLGFDIVDRIRYSR